MHKIIFASFTAFALFSLIGLSSLQAQKFSATANFSSFDVSQASSGSTTINYDGSTTLGSQPPSVFR